MTTIDNLERPADERPPPPGSLTEGAAVDGAGAAEGRQPWKRAARWYGERLWPTVLVLAALAAAATLSNSAGRYVGDNRLEQYVNPARRVARTLSIWDVSRGLGRVREDFWPGTTLPLAALRALGASPILTEHLWHAVAIVLAGAGMVQVLRIFRPRISIEHLLAAAVMSFGAFSATFLTPFSNLYFQYALAPWFVWVFYRGLHSEHRWKWAAGLALLIFAPGNVDTPGLLYNLMPLLAVAVYVVFVERAIRFRHLCGFLARAGPLALVVNAAVLVKIYQGAATYGQRLNDTEAAEISFRASSWTESFRGLGNWLSYYRDTGVLLKPQGALYFSNWAVIAFTFVPPLTAGLVLWLSRWRPRILFGMMALLSLVVLVGAYPLNEPSPLGTQVFRAFSNVTFFFAFRNTYKAGAGLVMGIAALFGVGAAAVLRRAWRRGRDRGLVVLPAALVLGTVVVTSFPFWSNNLYNPTQQSGDIPSYWADATQYLDRQPGDARVLILPETSRTRYRWGWVGDDIFDALLARPHAIATGVPLSTPLAANVLEAVSTEAANPAYQPGTLAPILRRLGIDRIVLRNDLDWRSLDRPRPAAYEGVRRDPGFRREAVFGAPGENTIDPDDATPERELEARLPPVEIWQLTTPLSPVVRVESPQPPLLVSGDGGAWAPLAAAGQLDSTGPVQYTGSMSRDELQRALRNGSPVAITDTNRRRLRVLLSYEPDYSYTLADGQDLDRPAQSLFPGEGTQSVAWFPDASSFELSGSPRAVGGSQPWYRAANAFDGDLSTAWLVRRNDAGRTFSIALRQPATVSRAVFTVANVDKNDEGLTRGRLRFSDGSEEAVNLGVGALTKALGNRTVSVGFAPRTTTSIEFTPTDVEGDKAVVGLADVSFDGVDAREYIQTPDDVFATAAADPDLEALLEQAPLSYSFTRAIGTGPVAEETAIRRRFRVAGNRAYSLEGRVRVTRSSTDGAIDRLVGAPVGAYGSERADGDPRRWAGFAVDGDARTGWEAPAETGETIIVRFPRQLVTSVSLSSMLDAGFTPIKRVQLVVGDAVKAVDLTPQQPCPVATDGKGCRIASVDVPPVETDRVEIRVTDLEGGPGSKLRIDEVALNGRRNGGDLGGNVNACRDVGIRVTDDKNQPRPVPVRLSGTLDDLLAGRTVGFTACEPVRLEAGWHLLDSGGGSAIDDVRLVATDGLPAAAAGPRPSSVTVENVSPTKVRVRGQADRGATVVLEQSYAKGWTAKVDGESIGPAKPYDSLSGWDLTKTGSFEMELVYGGQFSYGLALLLTAAGVVVCVALVLYRPGAPAGVRVAPMAGPAPKQRAVSPVALLAISLVAAAMAYLFSGFGFALVVASIAMAVWIYRIDPGRPVAMGAFVLLALGALATIVEVTPTSADPNLTFALARPITSLLGTLAGSLTAAAVALYAVTERSREPARPWFAEQRRAGARRGPLRSLPSLANRWAPVGIATALASALAFFVAPASLSAAYDGLVRNLRFGAAYSLAESGGAPTTAIPPLAPGLVAFSPIGGRLLAVVLAAASVLLVAHVANRRAGYQAALGAAFCAALLPSVWAVQLGVALAAVLVLAGVALADPSRLTLRRAAVAGACCGLAGLARPDALVAVPVVAAWILWNVPRSRYGWARAGSFAGTALLVLLPWLDEVRNAFGAPLPAATLADALADPYAGDRVGGAVGLAVGGLVLLGAGALAVRRRRGATNVGSTNAGGTNAGSNNDRGHAFARAWLPFLILPLVSFSLALAFPTGRDALGWSGLLVAVVVGFGLVPVIARVAAPTAAAVPASRERA